jgi:hypothetical protein
MFEGYCADIEVLLRDGQLRDGLRLSLALPGLAVALEDAQLKSSRERYIAWCGQWLQCPALARGKPNAIERLHSMYLRPGRASHGDATTAALRRLRMRRRARTDRSLGRSRVWHPVNRLQRFRVELTEGLLDAARRWYSAHAKDPRVQRNLARLAISA